jgi:ubiquinone/menaquinone biosynthesis C-methylase UbiE
MIDQSIHNLLRNVGGNILDIGCGRGRVIKSLLETNGIDRFIIGLDMDIEKLNEAVAELNRHHNVSFICSTSSMLPIRDNAIDNVISMMMLHELYIEDVEPTLDEAYRVLKSEGRLIVGDKLRIKPSRPSEELPILTEDTYHKAILYAIGKKKWGLHEASKIINMIQRKGFILKDLHHINTRILSPQEFLESWGRDTIRYIDMIKEDKKREEVNRMVYRIKEIASKHGYGPAKILYLIFKK